MPGKVSWQGPQYLDIEKTFCKGTHITNDGDKHYLRRRSYHVSGSGQNRELEELKLSRYRESGLWKTLSQLEELRLDYSLNPIINL